MKKGILSLVAAGYCGSAYGQNCDGQWLSTRGGDFNSTVRAFAQYDGQLIAAGEFNSVGSVSSTRAARWDGASWTSMSVPNMTSAYSLAVHDGDLYLGGNHVGAPPITYLRRFDGSNWVASGASFSSVAGAHPRAVRALGEYQGKLALGGGFADSAQTLLNVGLWDGAAWGSLGTSITGSAASMAVFRGELIVGGASVQFYLSPNTNQNSLLRYDGTSWHAVLPPNATGFAVNALFVHNDRLIIGSTGQVVFNAFSYGPLASWDGTTLSALGEEISSIAGPRSVRCIGAYNGDLVVGGQFDQIGGIAAHGLARWNGTSWNAFAGEFGEGLNGVPEVLAVSHDELIVGGTFFHAGGISSRNFARWTDDPKPWVVVSPASQTFNNGLTLALNSTLAIGYANSTYQWQRNGVDLANGPGGASPGGGDVWGASGVVTWGADGESVWLIISGVQPSDAGEYTVRFSNTCHDVVSATATITINTCLGDLNGDALVNDQDFEIFARAYDKRACRLPEGLPFPCLSDLNGDSVVDDADFQIFIVAYDAMICE